MDEDSAHPLLAEQQRRNQATRGHWQLFAPHRRRVTDLVLDSIPPTTSVPRLCVLGAGNCNDLDLPRLISGFARVRLVDWDQDALQQAVTRQGVSDDDRVQILGRIDLSGLAQASRNWSPSLPAPDQQVAGALAAADAASSPSWAPPAEVVASVCLLSQILEGLGLAIGPSHPRYLDLVQHLRRCHLRLILKLLAPGGCGLLISDVVSSDSAPQVLTTPEVELPALLARLIGSGNFFTGLNPAVLISLLGTDPEFRQQIAAIEPIPPWKWDLGQRTYAVYGVRFRRLPAQ